MPFGTDTIQLVSKTESGTPDELGMRPVVETVTNAPGCRHRPLTPRETAELQFDIATELWKSTIPIGEYNATLQNKVRSLKADDVIRVDGEEFQIVGGVQPFKDFEVPFKATIISQQQHG